MRTTIIGCVVAVGLVLGVRSAQADRYWDGEGGADTNWGTSANWSGNTLPTSGDDVYIGSGAPGVSPAGVVITASGAQGRNLTLGYGGNKAGTLTVTGGDLSAAVFSAGSGGTGTLFQSGGSVLFSGGALVGDGAYGSIQISGGRLSSPSATLYVGNGGSAYGEIKQTGGEIIASQIRLGVIPGSYSYNERRHYVERLLWGRSRGSGLFSQDGRHQLCDQRFLCDGGCDGVWTCGYGRR